MLLAASATHAVDTIAAIRAQRAALQVVGNNAGFSLPDSQEVMCGIDADSCRAFVAVLGERRWRINRLNY